VDEIILRVLGFLAGWLGISIIALFDNIQNGVDIYKMSWIDKLICAPALGIIYPALYLRRKMRREQ